VRLGFLECSGIRNRRRIGRAVADLVARLLERSRTTHRCW
jgi:hypothetical protein